MKCKIVLWHVAQFCGLIYKQTIIIQIGIFFCAYINLLSVWQQGMLQRNAHLQFLHWYYLLLLKQLNGALTTRAYYWTWPGSGMEISQMVREKEPFVRRCQRI